MYIYTHAYVCAPRAVQCAFGIVVGGAFEGCVHTCDPLHERAHLRKREAPFQPRILRALSIAAAGLTFLLLCMSPERCLGPHPRALGMRRGSPERWGLPAHQLPRSSSSKIEPTRRAVARPSPQSLVAKVDRLRVGAVTVPDKDPEPAIQPLPPYCHWPAGIVPPSDLWSPLWLRCFSRFSRTHYGGLRRSGWVRGHGLKPILCPTWRCAMARAGACILTVSSARGNP